MTGALPLRRLQVVQEIKILRSNVSQREREKAERATLVTQERLVKSKVRTAPRRGSTCSTPNPLHQNELGNMELCSA